MQLGLQYMKGYAFWSLITKGLRELRLKAQDLWKQLSRGKKMIVFFTRKLKHICSLAILLLLISPFLPPFLICH